MKINVQSVYYEYYPKVFRYLYKKTGSYHEAEDLTQEVFVTCLQHIGQYDADRAGIGTWIFVIANSKLKNYYRSRKEFTSIDGEDNPVELASEDYTEQAVLLEEQRKLLFEAIDSLSELEREIIHYKYFQKKKSSEIAHTLHLTDGNVRVILTRAIAKIHAYFVRHGY